MLSRRHIRIKIFQALYSYFKGSVSEIALGEKELMRSINKNYELFIHLLSILMELKKFEEKLLEERKRKRLPTEEDKNPNLRFINNKLLLQLSENTDLLKKIDEYKISWVEEQEFIRKIHTKITETESYKEYKASSSDSYEEDAAIIIRLFKNQIADHEMLQHLLEEKNIHWQDDHYFVCGYAVKALKQFNKKTASDYKLPTLFKDKDDDTEFIETVYRQVLVNNDEYQEEIMKKAKNWEADRIAIVDFILMKMALAELEKLPSIPVKVTLNEYIDISKNYSTPKSKLFINGVLDKIVADYKREGKIEKRGRGLMN
ncbi:MAG: N utilization substance protein B [Saprospiraceae bacterium]|jgi:N utilization substance protein B